MSDSLFENPKVDTRGQSRPPGWVVEELVTRWGFNKFAVRRMHARQAFACLYRSRERGPASEVANRRRALAARILSAVASDDTRPEELHDLLSECVALLDAGKLAELARVATALLVPPAGST